METRSKAIRLLIASAVLFGSLSLTFGFYFLLTSPSTNVSFLFGITSIVFGILDFIAALFFWKTGKLTWFILLFGPAIFIQAIPETWSSIFIIILPLTLLLVFAGLLFWITTKIPEKITPQMPYLKCNKCGNILTPDYQYCPYCGEFTGRKD